jgi:Ca2+-binding RTX toxin-like protein
MAIFKIAPANSVFTNPAGDNAFNDDTPGADTLTVDTGAHLISVNGNGAFLAATGAWTVTVNGSIVSQSHVGITLGSGDTAVSTIKIGVDGEVGGPDFGIALGGPAKLNNAGMIKSGAVAIQMLNGGPNTITNSGEINGALHAILASGTSSDRVLNSGAIDGNILLAGGNDTVMNFAIIGDVIKSGTITGLIDLSAGNDKFFGGASPEFVVSGDGADVVSLGGDKDTYIATGNFGADGIDIVRGGAGVDTYDASAAVMDFNRINLDTIAHDLGPLGPGVALAAANTATGSEISGSARDTIFGFENANGGHGIDVIYGSATDDTLLGGDGGDFLFGFGGNDTLDGGPGNDFLVGGRGKDQLTGGGDADAFVYAALSDSGITASTRDLIADFELGLDKIDLTLIDANTTNAAGTNDAFNFIGTNTPFTGTSGQLHAFWSAIGQIIEGDVNGDAKADFSIEIKDPTHAITLASTDFNL